MRNVSDKSCRENQNTHFMFSTFFLKIVPFMIYCAKYGTAGQATDVNIIWGMCFACWITNATDTHSEYVILIAFPWQQWFHESTSMLCFTYAACLVIFWERAPVLCAAAYCQKESPQYKS
jgi:hypothetical protein